MVAYFSPGAPELIIIVVGVLLLFGGKKIPELMRGLGSGLREFKKASNLEDSDNSRKESAKIEETTTKETSSSSQ
jgi:sec-independent protein translocase protein TatA